MAMRLNLFPYALVFILISCTPSPKEGKDYVAFTGATLIDGVGGEPIREGVLLVLNGRVASIGKKDEINIPEGAIIHDVTGRTIVPGIINGHGHVGETKGIEGGHYSKENIIDNLSLYARYGITTVISLGGDKIDAEAIRQVNDSLPDGHARLFIAGEIINGKTPDEANAIVDKNEEMGVDFMKIRVDDNLGTSPKMAEEIYSSVIRHAHERGYKVATHMYYLEDARKLVEAGSDMLAHSVRDLPVDDSFVQLLLTKQIPYCPTLTRELSTFVYGDTAEFFSDPFFKEQYDSNVIRPLLDPANQEKISKSSGAMTYEKQLPQAMGNLKVLSDRGAHIVFGTDSGVPTRFMGYFEHIEMAMMAEAGLTPMQIIVSATKNAAEYMGLRDLGTLAPGHFADFIVLDENPLEDIKNMRKIHSVFIGGHEVRR